MSHTYDRVSKHVLSSKRDVEQRQATHINKCITAIIEVQLDVAVMQLDLALTRMELKCVQK